VRVTLSSSQAANPITSSEDVLTLAVVDRADVVQPFTSQSQITEADMAQYTIRIGASGLYFRSSSVITCSAAPVAAGSVWEAQSCDTPSGTVINEIYDPATKVEAWSGYWSLISIYQTTVGVLTGIYIPSHGASGSGSSAPKTAPRSSSSGATVAVVRCPTAYGITPAPAEHALPSSIATNLSTAQARSLEFYGNNALLVLAPAGWQCSALIGADGTPSMKVARGQEGVTVLSQTAWAGASEACAFFPGVQSEPSGVPCSKIPANERVVRLNGTTVLFEDPPNVQGPVEEPSDIPASLSESATDLSGGSLPTNGVLVFKPGADTGFFFTETCVLPSDESSVCSTLLNDAATRAPN
jgi:hypothetical protein